ncbi:MAG: PIN domain-containing protein [Bacteroidales bacterium]|nr:PIN domain-containing protein [Bacteroidales bacterium]
MARLVLDTNSLIQCIARRSPYHELWLSFLDGRNTLCVTTEILNEYAEILERMTSPQFANLALDVLVNNPYTFFAVPFFHFHVIAADPDDDKFVDCAVVSNAKFIVTEDSHFNVLKSLVFPNIEIIKLDEIMRMI